MNKKEFFTVLIFILIIGIVFICQDLSKGATIMSFIVGFIVLRNHVITLAETSDKKAGVGENFIKIPTFDSHMSEGYSTLNNPLTRYTQRNVGNYREGLEDVNSKQDELKREEGQNGGEQKRGELMKKHLAEREYLKHESYGTPYMDPHPIISLTQPIIDSSMDSANTMMVRARTRDKRCLTGAVIKDASFYKKHYGDEFEQAEKSRWWGDLDY